MLPRLVLVGSCVVASATAPNASTPPREIALVARGMAFYLPGDATPNPTIRLAAGERVRVVVRNETAGMKHDFAVDSLSAHIGPLAAGRSAAVEFTAPRQVGQHPYRCRPHARMMKGMIEVVGR